MEKADLEAQERSDTFVISIADDSSVVFRQDLEGNILLWDKEGFIELCSNSQDPVLKTMLTIYKLGILEGQS